MQPQLARSVGVVHEQDLPGDELVGVQGIATTTSPATIVGAIDPETTVVGDQPQRAGTAAQRRRHTAVVRTIRAHVATHRAPQKETAVRPCCGAMVVVMTELPLSAVDQGRPMVSGSGPPR